MSIDKTGSLVVVNMLMRLRLYCCLTDWCVVCEASFFSFVLTLVCSAIYAKRVGEKLLII